MTSPAPNAGGPGDSLPGGVDTRPQDSRSVTASGESMNRRHASAEHEIESSSISSSSASTPLKGAVESGNAAPGSPAQRYDSNVIIGPDDRTELVRIATALSRKRSTAAVQQHGSKTLGAIDEHDTALDPEHGDFDLAKWIRHTRYGSVLAAPLRPGEFLSFGKKEPKQILQGFEGLVESGELLIVLGRPGSGCSTLLKTLCGELHGLALGAESNVHYNGIPQRQMQREFKGEAVYNQEVDRHFPHLTVGQTLEFAASARTPSRSLQGMSRQELCRYLVRVVMATFGLSHTYNTKVGNDYIRGVSGGERKRVSLAEMVLAGSPVSAWDNSTRGLDSATALKFVQSLRMSCDFGSQANAVAIYQASQAIYDLFDKATVLYQGRQIYFGPASQARRFFEEQGWYCPPRQTTGDFLTSITNPGERRAHEGMEKQVPRTPDEFVAHWRRSPEYQTLQAELDAHEQVYLVEQQTETVAQFREQKAFRQAKRARPGSPYLISILDQVALNTKRAYQRMWNDISATLTQTVSQLVMALIIGSIFYNTPDASAGFYSKGSVLFLAVLMNALTAISEISTLYEQRPIVEKHNSYALYHPFTEAVAGIAADIPIKFVTSTVFNLVLYFMAGLRREPGPFFLYFLINFMSIFVFAALFRTLAAGTRNVAQALAYSGVLVLALVIYTGFAQRVPDMHPWFSWIRFINPIFYAFEILIANEFHGREFACSSIVPPYSPPQGVSWICQVSGAVAGQATVSGDAFIAADYTYYYSHVWRNFGIICAFLIFFMVLYFITTELNSATSSTAEALVFQRGHVPRQLQNGIQKEVQDEGTVETKDSNIHGLPPQTDTFTWRDVVYDIEVKGQQRRLLDHVSGWVKPGTLTALMGVSGAGKTTLLDCLASRTSMGVITGDMLVNGKPRDPSFQRKTGYVQQQDLHLETATVRESLRFSATLRQPPSVSQKEKFAFVEEVIKMLNMEDFANAVVGVPGQGLNVEQRKLLTIGVELAAKPKLLLFLDEPTSGLDSQSSWAICTFLRKLADSGQAILCTVHQPSAILFQSFDRLLFLAKGGKTVYFGDIGSNSRTLLDYFESHGARHCGDDENPAEYMLEVRLRHVDNEFAMPFPTQLWVVSYRVLQQYWRIPSYVFSKMLLGIFAGLFIGFTFFDANSTQAGCQAVIFSVFMLPTIFSSLVQQIQPLFVVQRSLYEVRERPSKAYSWKAFIIANIMVEIPYQILTGILIFACFYFPVVGIQSSERQGLVLLFIVQLVIYSSAFAQMTIVTMPDAQTAGSVVTILVMMSILFCGVLQTPDALPGFWIFMYRASPFAYWISGIVATELHDRPITCSAKETSIFDPPQGMSCGQYLEPLLRQATGQLQNPGDTSQCRYCPVTNADQVLLPSKILWSERWRNYGIVWVFIVFSMAMAFLLYYLFRVKRWNSKSSGFSKLWSRFKKTNKGES
ncbi:ATP-binding cassette transporter ABC1 [Ophiocordyceps sinensis CO18]|uniref:ATP-binding cassette transporter ABC1 n=1 Tax=Ophiocordyceps sinensis (strain Co18 / CGMCC 3.14243) TaxID=911162 RepID=T5AJB1_OPHSC|nr:ATP-binding cassette transporter ABC1 [Ophiocordyceps sinensis CO18]